MNNQGINGRKSLEAKYVLRASAFIIAALLITAPALAAQTTNWGAITRVITGWNADRFNVMTNAALVNPGACPDTDLYAMDSADPGYKTIQGVLMLAFAAGKQVKITVEGCYNTDTKSRPHMIGVEVQP